MNSLAINGLTVIRRDGRVVDFDATKIHQAIANAFLKNGNGLPRRPDAMLSASERARVDKATHAVVEALQQQHVGAASIAVEAIQDLVELTLMRSGEHEVARDYVLFRQSRAQLRKTAPGHAETAALADRKVRMLAQDREVYIGLSELEDMLRDCCAAFPEADSRLIAEQALRDMHDGITSDKLDEALLLAARAFIERDPAYDRVTAQLLLQRIRKEVLQIDADAQTMAGLYPVHLSTLIWCGIEQGRLDRRLSGFDLDRLGAALRPERDQQFRYMGLQVLYDRYFLHDAGRRMEMPQTFFMRVAMGMALNEPDRDGRAIEFYEVLSSFRFMSSSPTLFNSGTVVPQLSSCYVSTIPDDLDGIYSAIRDNAMLQKYAGGLGNDWTPVRALGSLIRGTNGESQGVIPFLKVVNDTAVAVNQGGKRKGAVCAYLETWHLDVEEFIDLRKNTGDDRRRTHDMDTANWVPDLFMKRVIADGSWTLFSPVDVPDLHDKFGHAFEEAYLGHERRAAHGEIKRFKTVRAKDLWRRMLSKLFETGHPWICFKDACNVRSPQQHVGVVHSSNLCTEITLNTSRDEIAVCNLGSVNLAAHLASPGGRCTLDYPKLRETVTTAMRMLDNVIDLNHYAVVQARTANMRHRPVGLGLMGLQDVLYRMRLPFASSEALRFGELATEALAFYAYGASSALANERGCYESYEGSAWHRGVLPQDTLHLLRVERGGHVDQEAVATLDWKALRIQIALNGMRNSNCVAVAPTATIAGIVGVNNAIDPAFSNLNVKSNLSGEFTVVNEALVADLKVRGLWDEVMLSDLKFFEGHLDGIDRIPPDLKALYATAFDIPAFWLVDAAAGRQNWIDQAQSLSLYFRSPTGEMLDETYRRAWRRGLKTTYYLRTLGATTAEKSTSKGHALNAVAVGQIGPIEVACSLDDPSCDACQ